MKNGLKKILTLTLILLLQFGIVFAMDPVVLPEDESPHVEMPTEWWYFTGHLYGRDIFGRHYEYGFELNTARTDALGFEPAVCIYMGHLGISDIRRGKHKMEEMNIGIQPDVIPSGGGFNITVGNTHMDGKNGVNHIRAGFSDLSYSSINLTLAQSEPFAMHDDDGIMPYGPFGESGYYSQTKLDVSGYLFDHGMFVWITDGIAWHDHQWGNWTNGTAGWEWFSIQLDNNTEYMLYFIHDENWQPSEAHGTLVYPDGSTMNLDPETFSYVAHDSWTSPDTGNTYQQNWTVYVPGGTLTVTPQITDQEMWNPLISVMNYWEGSCTVTGTIDGSPVTGVAYQEQTLMMTMQGSGSVWEELFGLLGF